MPHANYLMIAKNNSVDISNCEKCLLNKSKYWSLHFIHQNGPPRKRNMTRHGGILTAIVRYLESTDNVADDFFNGLLKLSKLLTRPTFIHKRGKRQ